MVLGRGLGGTAWPALTACLLLPLLGGCAILNGFLDPTKVGQFPSKYHEQGIRRILTERDAPPGLPNATDPTEEDLVPIYDDYRIAPGDVLLVVIQDLRAPGVPEQVQAEVTPSGNLRVPLLGTVRVTGLTEQQLEEELTARLADAELLPKPEVQVFAVGKRQNVFTVRGAVGQAGVYPITDPDMRLLDVIGMVRDIGSNVPRLYVIRRNPRFAEPAAYMAPERESLPDGLVIPPPTEDEDSPAEFSTSVGLGDREPPPEEEQAADRAALEEIIAPGQATQPAGEPTETGVEPPMRPLVFDPQTGELVDVGPPDRPPVAEGEKPPAGETWNVEDLEQPFEWEDVPELELEQRVIEINVSALLAGDPRYNIVVREKDVINVPVDTGLFYMMGEVARPGVYAFSGRDITIKQAIAMTGGLGPFAFPMRCEIIRHERGTDKQLTIPVNLDAIFAGLAEDVYLRDDDIVNVGTHFVSPFLFVIRNSFRFTYGFGFVYDRNFADKDAYYGRQNPETLAQQRAAQRGLPF
ncbi:MAG: polysaccharide biosynthesis/export family protein [Phycisphaerae bacterium]|jgi:polysaccharide export outer membrane protein